MWATKVIAVVGLFASFVPICTAQDGTAPNNEDAVVEDPTAFANPDYNLTTATIEYQVYTGCGPQNNVTIVRERVSYVVFDGLAIIDGDIVYGTEQDILRDIVPDQGHTPALLARSGFLDDESPFIEKRALSKRTANARWPNAEIPYTFSDADVSLFLTAAQAEQRKQRFRDAVKIWTDRLPWLNMHELTDQNYDPEALTPPTRLTISLIEGCVSWSPVGRASTQEASVLSIGCISLGTYVHEIGHTLGLYHEHQRPDRDKYFTLDCSRIEDRDGASPVCTVPCDGWGCAFEFRNNPVVHNWEGPYDTNSVMHYFETSFGISSSQPPLIGVTADVRVGRTTKPTIFDLTRVCEIYHDQCFGKGICGDGILSPNNGEECDPGCGGSVSCTEDCKRTPVCGNGRLETGEECDDGPTGSATCGTDCKRITCIQTCNPDPRFNLCDQTTSCITVEGGTAASAGKHYCACRHGFMAPLDKPQMRLPWFSPISQEGRVFVEPGQSCNLLCDAWTLGKDGCKEVGERPGCY